MDHPVFPSPDGSPVPGAVSRRRLIGRLTAAGFSAPVIASILANTAWAQDATPEVTPSAEEVLSGLGKDTRLIQQGSTTFETPAGLFDSLLTPNELFFIRSNGPVSVEIDPAAWRLTIGGLVDQPMELSLADLEAMSPRTMTAFLECSGNSRGRFGDDPAEVEGTKWGNGAIGNAEWTGVPLADVLEMAGVQAGAVDVVCQGGDFEEMQRGLPLETAMNGDVMIVWQMNGTDIPQVNGGPVRLIVPGWGGIASTKWIVGLEVIDRAFDGYFNTESYIIVDEDETIIRPVTVQPVKSVITSVEPDETLTAGSQAISGFAWSGYGAIAMVEVSTDDGETWNEAEIVEEAGRLSWVRFSYDWDAQPGDVVLRSRATDERELQQPIEAAWNAKGYGMNAIYAVPVTVS
ncbi:MAG: hypothetical protein AVDCRST_MAG33-749 [uncultured Thermomicrobiales bacterium]|uniref:Sulfite oxidase n=1 Tax=uncultured Thermomicrobiales bacterium TaxID=1645740 RepID=A0A6J4UFG2_9BACT|nr:MAG: hypothetical protein AVDCRST_MAG33-749 [uncultured Thermomicrobiales bacterium]